MNNSQEWSETRVTVVFFVTHIYMHSTQPLFLQPTHELHTSADLLAMCFNERMEPFRKDLTIIGGTVDGGMLGLARNMFNTGGVQ